MVCAMKGYAAHFVSSDAFSKEKLQTMQAFGARLELIPSENGLITARLFDWMLARVKELIRRPNTFWTDQFNNVDNRSAYHAMAAEIMAVLGREIDEFVMGVGTGGRLLRKRRGIEKNHPAYPLHPGRRPLNVRALSGGDVTGKHRLEGIGTELCAVDLPAGPGG